MTIAGIDKTALLAELRTLVETDLEVLTASQEEAQAGATHEENKAEGDKDMRSTEDSYLARGLAKRVTELRSAVAMLSALALRSFAEDSKISLTAVVEAEDDEGVLLRYFVAPVGGGIVLGSGASKISVVTPLSPLGQALLGRELDDEVEIRTPQGPKSLSVIGIV
ncbi:MAG: GreA/GreB family elongation factor [Myxococcales bacterium]|nr:GreA/GreB family elongation factor [Myxococcales bacterium]